MADKNYNAYLVQRLMERKKAYAQAASSGDSKLLNALIKRDAESDKAENEAREAYARQQKATKERATAAREEQDKVHREKDGLIRTTRQSLQNARERLNEEIKKIYTTHERYTELERHYDRLFNNSKNVIFRDKSTRLQGTSLHTIDLIQEVQLQLAHAEAKLIRLEARKKEIQQERRIIGELVDLISQAIDRHSAALEYRIQRQDPLFDQNYKQNFTSELMEDAVQREINEQKRIKF